MLVNLEKCLVATKTAASGASEIIRKHSLEGFELNFKGGNIRDAQTTADLESERLIKRALGGTPYPVLGEELSPAQALVLGRPTWIIDPLDGTTNLAMGIPLYAVSIGLWLNQEALLGVVLNVTNERCYWAIEGGGAWEQWKSYPPTPLKVSSKSAVSQSLIGYDWPNKDALRMVLGSRILPLGQQAKSLRILGSAALGLCYVAAGSLDGYINYEIFPWDAAAGKLIIQEAGGRVTTASGENWPLDSGNLVATNGFIHGNIVSALK